MPVVRDDTVRDHGAGARSPHADARLIAEELVGHDNGPGQQAPGHVDAAAGHRGERRGHVVADDAVGDGSPRHVDA